MVVEATFPYHPVTYSFFNDVVEGRLSYVPDCLSAMYPEDGSADSDFLPSPTAPSGKSTCDLKR